MIMKNARTVVIVPVTSVFLAVIQFLAVNGFGYGAEIPHCPLLTVQTNRIVYCPTAASHCSCHREKLLDRGTRTRFNVFGELSIDS